MMVKEGKDVRHEGSDAAKAPATNHLSGNFAEEAFHKVEPRRRSRGEVQMNPGMAFEPRQELAMFMSSCRR